MLCKRKRVDNNSELEGDQLTVDGEATFGNILVDAGTAEFPSIALSDNQDLGLNFTDTEVYFSINNARTIESLASVANIYTDLDVLITTDASSSQTGALRTDGGAGIAKKLYVGTGIYLPTSGGTAAELNHYEEVSITKNCYNSGDGSTDFFTTSETMTLDIVRVGKLCVMSWDTVSGTGLTATDLYLQNVFSSYTHLLPSFNVRSYASVQDNGTWKAGGVIIDTVNNDVVFRAGAPGVTAPFAGAGATAISQGCLCWTIL